MSTHLTREMVSFLNYELCSFFSRVISVTKPRPEILLPSLLKIAKVNRCAGSQTPSVSHVKASTSRWSVGVLLRDRRRTGHPWTTKQTCTSVCINLTIHRTVQCVSIHPSSRLRFLTFLRHIQIPTFHPTDIFLLLCGEWLLGFSETQSSDWWVDND
jgi:hypothetical protein